MLILSRHPGQKVVFPDLGISIEILRSSGTATKLGITAPLDVEVHREEVLERKNAFVNDLSGPEDPGSECRMHLELKDKIIELKRKLQSLQSELEAEAAIESDDQLANIS
jgi:carbon storage regulator CsrA